MKKLKFSLVIPVAPNRSCEILESIKELDYSKEKFETIANENLKLSKRLILVKPTHNVMA